MSSFLISEKHLADLAESIVYLMDNTDRLVDFRTNKLRNLFTEGFYGYKVAEVGRALFEMNMEALNERYGNESQRWLEGTNLEVEYQMFDKGENLYLSNKFQLLKSLECYLYQCNEGDIPYEDLYRGLDTIRLDLMYHIIKKMPEYQKADWR